MKLSTKLLAVTAILAFVVASPVAAQNKTPEFDRPGTEEKPEIDDSNLEETAVNREKAVKTARRQLSNRNWTLEETETGKKTYEFKFSAGEREAEVTVNQVTGEVVKSKEDTEKRENSNRDEERNASKVQTLEEARKKIQELREKIRELRNRIQELKKQKPELPEEAAEQAREARNRQGPPEKAGNETDERSGNETDVKVEQKTENRTTKTEIKVEKNGTEVKVEKKGPAKNSKRPGFVSGILNSIFG